MAFVPVPNTAKITVRGTLGGQLIINTLHVQKAGTLLESDLTSIANITIGWIGAVHRNNISSLFRWDAINVLNLTSDSAPSYDAPISPAIVGVNTSGSVSNNVAYVISFRSLARGRSSRGRWYSAGTPLNQVASTITVSAAYSSAMGASFTQWFNNLRVADYTPVVVSTFTDGAQRSEGVTFPIVAIIADLNLDSQRRRLEGRGL